MKLTAITFLFCLAFPCQEFAQQRGKAASADLNSMFKLPTMKDIQWDAVVNKDNPRQVTVVIDLTGLSPLQVVKNLVASVAFYSGSKFIENRSFTLTERLNYSLPGGKKYVRNFEYNSKATLKSPITIRPLSLDGKIEVTAYVNNPPDTHRSPA